MSGDTQPRAVARRRWLLAGAVLVAVLGAAAIILARPGAAPTSDVEQPGQRATADGQARAPRVAFERFDGRPTRLQDWRGRPVVVNFWASWCPPCVAEMRDAFEPLHDQLGDRIAFLGVDVQDTRAAARDVVERTGVTYQLAADPDGALFTAFGGFGMPTTVLVDADGHVVAQHTGALTRAELDGLVRTHLLEG